MTAWPPQKLWQRLLASQFGEYILPTLSTLYVNCATLPEPGRPPIVSEDNWSRRERHALLARSEERLRSLEAKGPGLAAVCAVVAAAVLLAFSKWNDATLPAKMVLAAATVYALVSLGMPIYLVGAQPRATITADELANASRQSEPEIYLAELAAQCESQNVWRTMRLVNLQNAARNDLAAATLLLVLWALLVPVTGLCSSA